MRHISTSLLFLAGLALAGCGSIGNTGSTDSGATMSGGNTGSGTGAGTGGTARTTSGAEAGNADVKGSTSATGAMPANAGERR
jgi:hypothetical protein